MRLNIPKRVSITLRKSHYQIRDELGITMAENSASKRLPGEGLATCYFYHAQPAHVSQAIASRIALYIKTKNILAHLGLLGNE